MDTPALLPCPFCGGTASLDCSVGGLFVECDACEARGPFVDYEDFPDQQKATSAAAAAWNQRSAWQHPREGTEMTDNEFNALCDAHGFSAVARNEFPLVPRNLLKALVDAAALAERARSAGGSCPELKNLVAAIDAEYQPESQGQHFTTELCNAIDAARAAVDKSPASA